MKSFRLRRRRRPQKRPPSRQAERRGKKRGGGPRRSKRDGEAARAEKKRLREQAEADQAKRKKETTCGYCSSTWKGGAQWLWCEYCDEVCICAGCQKSGPTSTEFAAHEKTHEID